MIKNVSIALLLILNVIIISQSEGADIWNNTREYKSCFRPSVNVVPIKFPCSAREEALALRLYSTSADTEISLKEYEYVSWLPRFGNLNCYLSF